MHLKLFTLPFSKSLNGFDDSQMRSFLEGKEVTSVQQNAFTIGGEPYWAILVKYKERASLNSLLVKPIRLAREAEAESKPPVSAPPAELTQKEKELYERLRTWRMKISKTEGVPLYAICLNKELEILAKAGPADLNALKSMKRIRPTFVARYGEEVLRVLQQRAA